MSIDDRQFDEKLLYGSSVPIKDLSSGSIGSGCLFKYKGKNLLMTAAHVIKDNGKPMLELRYDANAGKSRFFALTDLFYKIKSYDISSINLEVESIDFAFAILEHDEHDIKPYFQQFSQDGNIEKEFPRFIFTENSIADPKSDEYYAFSGLIKPEKGNSQTSYDVKQTITHEIMTFSESINDNEIFSFEPLEYAGNENYKGCSGSPIIDNKGKVVAILIGGDSFLKKVYGINISIFTPVFDELSQNVAK